MRGIKLVLVFAFSAALAWGAVQLKAAFEVAVGYSAKQLCSGLFVSHLPENFVREKDILPRMSLLGPARSLLRLSVDAPRQTVHASLLFARARAGLQSPATGCTLHRDGVARAAAVAPAPAGIDSMPARVNPTLEAALDAAFREPVEDPDREPGALSGTDAGGGARATLAIVVAQRGRIVAERYAEPVTRATRLQGWSMNKSLLATWVGMLADGGEISVDMSVRRRLQELGAAPALLETVHPSLTLAHLLQMESGFGFSERYGPGSDVTDMLYRQRAMWQSAPRSGQAFAPGNHFSYSSGDINLAALLWQNALPGEAYAAWIESRFATPLGLASLVAEADASGIQVASSYAFMRARDWLRVGQLWLDAWHGRSQLLSAEWQQLAVRARPSDAAGRYGRGFWLNTGGVAFPGLPESLFYAGGNAGQYVIVIPQAELVMVRLGLSDAGTDTGVHALLASALGALSP